MFWTAFAAEPARAIKDFIAWIDSMHQTNTRGDQDPNNIMLAAHNRACHHHIWLIRMMLKYGIDPPNYRLTDTLVLFKAIKGKETHASLSTLWNRYAPWVEHVARDADSDAFVLSYVTRIAFEDAKLSCYPFGISCGEFTNRTGMNMFPHSYSSLPLLLRVPFEDSDVMSMSYETDEGDFDSD
ncbi:Ribonuclease H-like protein [Metarhizium rileyi]|uniref:Ribonuclease H-like protein n=1 Tax=Metarhizium rileyi (strain RCEF 4871) TaxID=1649241 RepID=A0A166YKQ9_METRR|nr:Ribonuclease H-like protein [Metarhizium rileyi RCEF 4871]